MILKYVHTEVNYEKDNAKSKREFSNISGSNIWCCNDDDYYKNGTFGISDSMHNGIYFIIAVSMETKKVNEMLGLTLISFDYL